MSLFEKITFKDKKQYGSIEELMKNEVVMLVKLTYEIIKEEGKKDNIYELVRDKLGLIKNQIVVTLDEEKNNLIRINVFGFEIGMAYLRYVLRENIKVEVCYMTTMGKDDIPINLTFKLSSSTLSQNDIFWYIKMLDKSLKNKDCLEHHFYVCKTCKNKNGKFKCSNCKIVRYCSKNCQSKDWTKHKKICKKIK